MNKVIYITFFGLLFFCRPYSFAQKTDASLVSDVLSTLNGGEHIPYANILIIGTTIGTSTDGSGHFMLNNLPEGKLKVKASAIGYISSIIEIEIRANETRDIRFLLEEDLINLESVVITATRNKVNRSDVPVIVSVIDSRIFSATQSTCLAQGLNFQPGLRLENNCQNCGYTQVRMNGLQGSYSQILINSRPVFSSLLSIYGLEQIPSNMIDRVEVVRGGGSALYGGNAIAGTINVITKEPINNTYQLSTNHALIGGKTPEHMLNGNISLVSDDFKSGFNLNGMYSSRDYYDANGDDYSEISKNINHVFGGSLFFKPNLISKIKLDFHSTYEFRRGGNSLDSPPHLADLAEQLEHDIFGSGLSYDVYSKDYKNKYAIYTNLQKTRRYSYFGSGGNPENDDLYGGLPEDERIQLAAEADKYYGNTDDFIWVNGFQFSRNFTSGTLTTGIEQQYNQVKDRMPGYDRSINQKVDNIGTYGQYELNSLTRLRFLLGLRYDYVNVDGKYDYTQIEVTTNKDFHAINPRISLLYDIRSDMQFRMGYARGFRAPQAFDEDLHITHVGGQAQYILLSDDLIQETSDAFSASLDFNGNIRIGQYGVLLEGFYTVLHDSFVNIV